MQKITLNNVQNRRVLVLVCYNKNMLMQVRQGYIMASVIIMTKAIIYPCRKGILWLILFSHNWIFQGQDQPVNQVTAVALLKYGQKCTLPMCDFERIKNDIFAININ